MKVYRNALFLLLLISAAEYLCCQTGTPKIYTYFWQPRQDDVGKGDDSGRKLLVAILRLSKPINYTVVKGDSIDFIIRKRFFVSQGDFPNAFQAYLQRIRDLNPGLNDQTVLQEGQPLMLPGAPQFSAIRLWKPDDTKSPNYFSIMSAKAFDARNTSDNNLAPLISRTLKTFVSNDANLASINSYNQIKSLGLLRAIDLDKHPGSELAQGEPIDLYPTTDTESLIGDVRHSDGSHLYRGLFPMAAPLPVTCGVCEACKTILKLSPDASLSRARILIEDAGVDLNLISKEHLEGMVIPQPVTSTYPVQAAAQDLTADSHGTFVYSQLVQPSAPADNTLRGVFPEQQVFATRVARTVDAVSGTQVYSMSDILAGWKEFEKRITDPSNPASKGAAQTWVVNMSLFGEDTDSTDATPAPPKSDHLLFVVAAGNGKSSTDAALYAFSRFTGPGNAVLSVGALGTNGIRASYSNYHPDSVSVAAQGDCVCGAPGQISGTSQATPVVTTAAAVLASTFPSLKPLEVMWRLISTADRQAPANPSESFGGTLNLATALNRNIIVAEDTTGSVKYHSASDIVLPQDLTTESSGQELLRVSRSTSGGALTSCFDVMHVLQQGTKLACPASASTDTVTYTENGSQPPPIPLNHIVDIILPLPSWRSQDVSFPEVQVDN